MLPLLTPTFSAMFRVVVLGLLLAWSEARGDQTTLIPEHKRDPHALAQGQYRAVLGHQNKNLLEQERVHQHSKDEFVRALDFTVSEAGNKGKQPVIVILVDGLMARLHLPIFLRSLDEVGVGRQVVVFALDDDAREACLMIHPARLCASSFGSSDVNGTHVPVMYDEEGGLESWHHKGWMKTSLTLKTLLLGYDVMFMDIDMIAFHNPFSAVNPKSDIAVTVDCNEDYTPYQDRRDLGGPNLGLTFFRSSPHMISLVSKWLEKRHPDTWDQDEFKHIVEATIDENPSLNVQMLKKEQFPVLCCEYCDNFLKSLVQRAWGWRDHCPRQERDKWIVFHATCINHYQEIEDLEYDEGIIKQDILYMIKDLKTQDKLNRS